MALDALTLFLEVFLLTQVVFGGIVGAFLVRVIAPAGVPDWALVVLGVGLAPSLVSLLLYYLLWWWPGLSHLAVLVAVFAMFAALAWAAGRGWGCYPRLFRKLSALATDRSMWLYALCTVGFMVLTVVLLVSQGLTEHDILEYGTQGGIFLREMAIHYQPHHYDSDTGFYYVALHGFSFPLLFTWEGLLSAHAAQLDDPWVRSLTPFHAWLSVSLLWGVVRRVDRWVAVWTTLAFGGSMGFFFLATVYHLDAIRIFLFMASTALLAAAVYRPNITTVGLLGWVCSAGAGFHSLGAIVGVMFGGLLLFTVPGRWKAKLAATTMFYAVFLVGGGIHYLMDVLFGTGWVFKDIVWY
jgi:hypothetical protein